MHPKARVPAAGFTPPIEKGTVPPRRRPNAELRPREYLTPAEVERLPRAEAPTGARLWDKVWGESVTPRYITL